MTSLDARVIALSLIFSTLTILAEVFLRHVWTAAGAVMH